MPGPSSKRQSNRTKGNVKPASSSQANELLSSAGTAATGFIGFGQSPKYVPVSSSLDDMDSTLDSDFRMVLRKLTKRDTTTKIKGLQEFSDLCEVKTEDDLKAVLPFWPRNYGKMVLDVDHRVRETTQHAMKTLVSRVRKNVAPYIKELMGPWLMSQCDTYPTVSSAALTSFQAAFPPAKQADAISFCKQEIINYLSDHLTIATALTLSDTKTTEPEDMEAKYNRVLTSSLLALRKLLEFSSADQLESLKEPVASLLENAKFWKHGKSKISMIKGAFFALLATLCQSHTELSTLHVGKVAPLVFSNLDTTDPAMCNSVWEAVLSLVNYIPDAWSHVNSQKAFWPKVKVLLENSCYGNATVVAPSLLPLVSRIPTDFFPDTAGFYDNFFSSFKLGLGMQSSSSECNALVKAFMECALYIVKNNDTVTIATNVLMDHVLPVIEASLTEKKPGLSKSSLYGMLGTTLSSIEMPQHPAHRDTAGKFWNLLSENIGEKIIHFDKSSAGESSFDNRVIHLVRCLFYPQSVVKQKPNRVRISLGKPDVELSLPEMTLSEQKFDLSAGGKSFVRTLVVQTFEHAHKNWSTEHLRVFSQLIEFDSSDETVAAVIQCCHGNSQADQSSSGYFVFNICLPWLQNLQEKRDSDKDFTHLIHVICVFISILESESVQVLLEKLNESLTDMEALAILIKKLFHLYKTNSTVKEWIRGDRFGDKLVSIATSLCDTSSTDQENAEDFVENGWAVLTLVLSAEENDEPVVSKNCIQRILTTVQQSLLQLDLSQATDRADTAVKFVAKAAQSFFCGFKSCLLMLSAVDLLMTLVDITLSHQQKIQGETIQIARQAWSSGILATVRQTGGYFSETGVLTMMCARVRDTVQKITSLTQLETVLECVQLLMKTVREGLPADLHGNPILQTVCQQLLVEKIFAVPQQVWEYEYVCGHFPHLPTSNSSNVFPAEVLFTSLYNCRLLHLTRPQEGAAGDSEVESKTGSVKIDWTSDRLSVLLNCVKGYSIVRKFSEVNTKVYEYPVIIDNIDFLSASMSGLLKDLSLKQSEQIWQLAFNCSEKDSDILLCFGILLSHLTSAQTGVSLSLTSILDRCSDMTARAAFLLHSTVKHLSEADQLSLTEIMVARIMSLPQEELSSLEEATLLLSSLRPLLSLVMTSEQEVIEFMVAVLDQILVWKENKDDILLFSCDLNDASPAELLFNSEVCRFLQLVLSHITKADSLQDKHWDFISCGLVSWIQSLEESRDSLLLSVSVQCLTVSVCDLLTEMSICMAQRVAKVTPESKLLTEWDEFFSESAFSAMLPLLVRLYKDMNGKAESGTQRLLLTAVCQAASLTPQTKIIDHQLSPNLIAGDLSPLPDTLQTLMNCTSPMLISDERALQLAAFSILNRVMAELPQYDKEDKSLLEEATAAKEENSARSPPDVLMAILEQSCVGMDALLSDLHIEKCLPISPHSQEYHYVLAYLLSWKLVLQFFRSAPAQLRQEYAEYFRERRSVDKLMHHIFRLMPSKPSGMVDIEPSMLPSGTASQLEIQHISCSLYVAALKTMPAMVRVWWKEQDRKTSAYIDKFTSAHVSQFLCRLEIHTVQETDVQLENIKVKARPATREVIATYCVDEVSIEMVITLSPNYPLGNISVQSDKRVGVTEAQWKKWLLQLNIFLQHQNGSIMDGLRLWKNNIDKRFEGVDDCMICFSVLHGTNFQLPRITCKTCKKRFHSACLYKWFHTSQKSTCPLCRNVF